MTSEKYLRKRTKEFALKIIKLVESLPKGRIANVIGNQLLRSATSVGANYRTASRARSQADFIAQMGIVEQKVDESLFWMELLLEAEIVKQNKLEWLMKETDEIIAMVVSSINTARKNK